MTPDGERRFTELAEAQLRTERALQRLAEAQLQTEGRLQSLEQRVEQLAEAQRRTEERVEHLAKAQRQTEQRLQALLDIVGRMETQLIILSRNQDRMETRLDRMETHLVGLSREVGALGRRAGAVFETKLGERVGNILDAVGLRTSELASRALQGHMRRLGASEEDIVRLGTQPDWLGRADGPSGSALVLAEASLTAEVHDVDRLESWRSTAERFGIPTIVVLVARDRSTTFPFPGREELITRRITAEISDQVERVVPEPALGDFALVA